LETVADGVHGARMKMRSVWRMIAAWMVVSASAAELPDVEAAIPPPVKALGVPAFMEFPGGIRMAVTAADAEAQAHVNQGLNHLHAGWEFEASRHFAAAMRRDPSCLLAHWGMVMSLIDPGPESLEARNAAALRMLELVEQGGGTELERGHAYGLVKYMQEGAAAAADAFRKVAARFPNDVQTAVLAALFGRGGYDAFGEATPDQERSEKQLLALIARFPDNPAPLHALLFIRAEGGDPADSLAMVEKLGRMVPDYPPFLHLAGHWQWRAGHHAAAATAFGRSAELYQQWREAQKAAVADCPEWIKAESYRAAALASMGDFEEALKVAKNLAATPLAEDRPSSSGNRMLLWEAKTLPARILLARAAKGDVAAAAASLPKPDSLKKYHAHTLAYWWIDGLRFVIEAERLLEKKDLDGTRDVLQALTLHGESLAKIRSSAAAGGEASFWNRTFRALEVLASDLRGRVALAGPANLRGSAYNWFSSAADRQLPASLLMPPAVLTPMASRLGRYFLDANQFDEAIEAYLRALAAFPNDIGALTGLKSAYEKSGRSADAAEVGERIETLRSGSKPTPRLVKPARAAEP
jgi:tetratricopeptide (TPR) repeat protein